MNKAFDGSNLTLNGPFQQDYKKLEIDEKGRRFCYCYLEVLHTLILVTLGNFIVTTWVIN